MTSKKVLSIQGLRGVAALIVFFNHAFFFYKSDFFSFLKMTPFHLFFDGELAVMLFFVISGFFYYPPRQKQDGRFETSSYLKGIAKKWVRIYPAYWIVMIFAFVGCLLQIGYNHELYTGWCNSYWARPLSLGDFLKQMSIYLPFPPEYINPPIWYMKVETKMIIIAPILSCLIYKKGIMWASPFLLFIFVGNWTFICFFVLGMMAHYLAEKYGGLFDKIGISTVACIVAVFMLNIRNEYLDWNEHLTDVIRSLGGALLLMIVYVNNPRFLCAKPLVGMGNISYEFYLVHFVVLLYMRPSNVGPIMLVVIGLLLSLVIACFLNIVTEFVLKQSRHYFGFLYE